MSRRVRRVAASAALVLLAGVLPAIGLGTARAEAEGALFAPAPEFRPSADAAALAPDEFNAVRVDVPGVRAALSAASLRAATAAEIDLPTPTGGTERFRVLRTQRMEAGLAAAHPEIATYSGSSLDHPGTTVALDVTSLGVHAFVRGVNGQGAWYVDPADRDPASSTHLSYPGGAIPTADEEFVERIAPELEESAAARSATAKAPEAQRSAGAKSNTVVQRIYRLALTSDPAYAEFYGSEHVTEAKVTLINRVNQVYNDDLGIELRLVDETDALNFDTDAKATGANGPCGAHPCFDAGTDVSEAQLRSCDVPALGRNRTVLGQLVGAGNYDVGHLALGVNGGGVAYLGVAGAEYKGGGCTGLPRPEGDVFAIDFVAHELGHQFAGNHTFNGVEGACYGGNRNGGTSVEPGSGSSVMAYAGICGQDDLQPHTDPYFSQRTIQEVTSYTSRAPRPVVEVQTVSLRGFDAGGEKITLGYGAATPVTLTRDIDYNATGVEAAIEQLTGANVTIRGWGYDPQADEWGYPGQSTTPDDTGFQVIFAGSANPATSNSNFEDMDLIRLEHQPRRERFRRGDHPGRSLAEHRNPGRHRQPPARGPGAGRPDDPAADAVRPHRVGDRRGRRRADLPVGAERPRWLLRHPPDQQRQAQRAALPDLRRQRPGVRVRRLPVTLAGPEPRDRQRHPELPRPPAGAASSYERQDGGVPSRPERPLPAGRAARLLLGVPPHQGVQRHRRHGGQVDALPADRPRRSGPRRRRRPRRRHLEAGAEGRPVPGLLPDRKLTLKRGSRPRIRWKVNGTRSLASHVRIRLSTDGGRTWGGCWPGARPTTAYDGSRSRGCGPSAPGSRSRRSTTTSTTPATGTSGSSSRRGQRRVSGGPSAARRPSARSRR